MITFSRIALVALLAIPTLVYADVTQLKCVQTDDTGYLLSYALTGGSHEVRIFASTQAQPSASMKPLLKTRKDEVTVHAGRPGQRMYFFIQPDHGKEREVSIRHLPLQGTPNFRDLGGYETADGRFVRWGLIYRSGVLSYLTTDDFEYLSQLHIHVICDFRTKQENAAAPETWIPGSDVDHVHYAIGEDDKDGGAAMRRLLANNPSPDELRERMTKVYSGMAFQGADQFAKLFAQIETDPLPVLYHCTAGKDRTGLFSAFLLLTLGVPEKTVLADYALTDTYLLNAGETSMRKTMKASANPALAQLSPAQRSVLMAANPAYLHKTLSAINDKFGSFANYRRQSLHVSDEEVQKLQSRLLRP